MSCYMEWEIKGRHKDGSWLTGEEVRELISLDEWDLDNEDVQLEADTEWIGDFSTESLNTYSVMQDALAEFAARHPDIILEVYYRYDTSWVPDGFVLRDGKVREVTGHATYTYDDSGEEVAL